MSPSLSCRVTAGCTSILFGRHTDGAEVQSFQNSPVFVGIKVVQCQGSAGIHRDLLISFKKWYLREKGYTVKNAPPNYSRIELIQEPLGARVCTQVCV